MRTTLDIDDDVLQAAKTLAKRKGRAVGEIISAVAPRGLELICPHPVIRNGAPLLPSRDEVITPEHIRQLMDEEGI